MSAFLAIIGLILVVWWPLVVDYVSTFDPRYPIWVQIDWLLIGVFAVMSLLIMAGADVRTDWVILLVGLGGGLVIETWGTQTQLWTYYTLERPPLWIIPAWPIASLSIDRLYRFLNWATRSWRSATFDLLYWTALPAFLVIMVAFVAPTLDKSLTWGALALCVLITLTPRNARAVVLTFAAGAGLGYFLELWGTTRACWTYYTGATPPLFAVLAHGMAAVAFWRTAELLRSILPATFARGAQPAPASSPEGTAIEPGSASEPHVTPPLSA
ncbi:MAG: hypothetical protein FJZ97_05705 [Chloroflexi bacterium]|nr:hypothetical protein [Chloroflexota bacterium]